MLFSNREEMKAKGIIPKKKRKQVSPTVMRIIEEYWQPYADAADADDVGRDPVLGGGVTKKRDWSVIFE